MLYIRADSSYRVLSLKRDFRAARHQVTAKKRCPSTLGNCLSLRVDTQDTELLKQRPHFSPMNGTSLRLRQPSPLLPLPLYAVRHLFHVKRDDETRPCSGGQHADPSINTRSPAVNRIAEKEEPGGSDERGENAPGQYFEALSTLHSYPLRPRARAPRFQNYLLLASCFLLLAT